MTSPETRRMETAAAGGSDANASGPNEDVLVRVGQMTRNLHEALCGLGFDKLIVKAAHDIPNARDRLDYVAKMTEQAAQRVLTATETAGPLQERIDSGAGELAVAWQSAIDGPFSEAQYRALAERTIDYLDDARNATDDTRKQLMDIMMAQDFQDLTGQVIRKVTELAHSLEQQLIQLLLDYAPAEVRKETGNSLVNGPQVNPSAADVVSDQGQVDELLESLGF